MADEANSTQQENSSDATENQKEQSHENEDVKQKNAQAAKNAVEEYIRTKQPEVIKQAVKEVLEEKQSEQNMTDQQLADKKLAEHEAELKKREAELTAKEQRNLATSLLAKNKLSTDFADYLVGKDEKETKAKVEAYVNSVKANVSNTVSDMAKGKQDPPAGVDHLNPGGEQKKFSEMTFAEKIALHRKNPAKYEELRKGAR